MATTGIFGVVETPDPVPSFTIAVEDLEILIRVGAGTLTQLFALAANFGQYSQAYRAVTGGATQKISVAVLSSLSQMLELIGQAYGPALSSFEHFQDPNVAALLEMLAVLEDSVHQLQILPALLGLDTSADGSTAISTVAYQVRQGDTLESIAAIITGDSSNWVDIARYNDIDIGIVGSETPLNLWLGTTVNVPVTPGISNLKRDPAVWDAAVGVRALGRNFGMQLATRTRSDGFVDIDVLDYTNTLLEGLSARLDTQLGAVPDNLSFGSYLPILFGHSFGDMNDQMLSVHIEATLLADPRVEEVLNLQVTRDQDAITAYFQVRAINGITTNQLLASFDPSEAALLDSIS